MTKKKFETGQLILLRMGEKCTWNVNQYFHEDEERLFVLGGFYQKKYTECVSYEGNEHLLGTKNDPTPKWQPKPGDLVAVSDDNKKWFAQVFISKVRGRIEGAYEASDTHDSSQPAYWQYCEPLRNHFNIPD